MFVPGLIERKRDGGALSAGEWGELIAAFHAGAVPDYQMAALLMAVFLRGMSREETAALLDAMVGSGSRLDFAGLGVPVVDKHSTGGVGDKTSLVIAPIVAAAGLLVPMISGRGLGHTGGTLDKLESIPGFNVNLSLAEFLRVLDRCGCALIGQTAEIAPADKKLYALRDVTFEAIAGGTPVKAYLVAPDGTERLVASSPVPVLEPGDSRVVELSVEVPHDPVTLSVRLDPDPVESEDNVADLNTHGFRRCIRIDMIDAGTDSPRQPDLAGVGVVIL